MTSLQNITKTLMTLMIISNFKFTTDDRDKSDFLLYGNDIVHFLVIKRFFIDILTLNINVFFVRVALDSHGALSSRHRARHTHGPRHCHRLSLKSQIYSMRRRRYAAKSFLFI